MNIKNLLTTVICFTSALSLLLGCGSKNNTQEMKKNMEVKTQKSDTLKSAMDTAKTKKDTTVTSSEPNTVVLETSMGDITIELYVKDAPQHVANFKKLVSSKFYDGTTFHRVIPGFMIQGGD